MRKSCSQWGRIGSLVVVALFVAAMLATFVHHHDDHDHHAETCLLCKLHSEHASLDGAEPSTHLVLTSSEDAVTSIATIRELFAFDPGAPPRAPPFLS